MRIGLTLLSGACAAALWCTPAGASQIVQTVSGTTRAGDPLTLFDPSLGTLQSVQIEGTLGWYEDILRLSGTNAVNNPRAASADLIFGLGPSVASATLNGNETYAAGSMFGSISLSGALFALLTGGSVSPFIQGPSTGLFTISSSVAPTVGSIMFNPGSPSGNYSLTVTYNYAGVPEPSTWATMLLGLGAIGFALRRRASRTMPA